MEIYGGRRTPRNKIQTPPTNHQTKRHKTPSWSKLVKTATNYHQQNPTGQKLTNQKQSTQNTKDYSRPTIYHTMSK